MARPIPVTEWSKIPAETAAYYSYVTTPHASVAHPVGGTAQEVFQAVAQALTGVPQQDAVEERQVQLPQPASVAEGGTGQDALSLTSLALAPESAVPPASVMGDPQGLASGGLPVPVASTAQPAAGTKGASVGTGAFALDQDHGRGLEQRPSSEQQVVQGDKNPAFGATKQSPVPEQTNAREALIKAFHRKAQASVISRPLIGLSRNQQRTQADKALAAKKPSPLSRQPNPPFLAGGFVHHPY